MACVPLGCFRCSVLATVAVEAEAVGVAAAISDADGISGGRIDGDDGESDDGESDDDDAASDDEEGDEEESVAFVEGGGGERMAGSPGGEGGRVMAVVVAIAAAAAVDVDEEAPSPSSCRSMTTLELEGDEVDWSIIISPLCSKWNRNPKIVDGRLMGSPTYNSMNGVGDVEELFDFGVGWGEEEEEQKQKAKMTMVMVVRGCCV